MNQPPLTDGANLLVDALKANHVKNVYGLVGIPVTGLAEIMQEKDLRFLGFRHETSAANAAAISGYLTGTPGICLTTSGAGFLNGLVGAAAANVNCFPMVLISGSSSRDLIDLERGAYDGLDQFAAAKPLVKAAYRVNQPQDVGLAVARAVRTAISGRPGAVYLDVPSAVLSATISQEAGSESVFTLVDPAPAQPANSDAVNRAVTMLRQAKAPLIVVGKGAAYAKAEKEVTELVESTGIPFLPMPMGKGVLPDTHPQSAAAARSLVLQNADVVVMIGARLNWLMAQGQPPKWNPEAQFIQIDIDPTEMDSNRQIAAPLVGDIASVVGQLNKQLKSAAIPSWKGWNEVIDQKKAANVAKMQARLAVERSPMGYFGALNVINKVMAEHPDIYLVNEGANTLDNTRDVVNILKPRHRLDTGTWGVMGIGMGYAIGAAVETGGQVLAVEGDSAFGFSAMDVETICRYRLPIIVVVFNNGGIYNGDAVNEYGTDPAPTVLDYEGQYETLATAFGGMGFRVTTPEELDQALRQALSYKIPTVINASIDPALGTQSGHLSQLNPSLQKN